MEGESLLHVPDLRVFPWWRRLTWARARSGRDSRRSPRSSSSSFLAGNIVFTLPFGGYRPDFRHLEHQIILHAAEDRISRERFEPSGMAGLTAPLVV